MERKADSKFSPYEILTGIRPVNTLDMWSGMPTAELLNHEQLKLQRKQIWEQARINQFAYLESHKRRLQDSTPWPKLRVRDVVMVFDNKPHHSALQAAWMAPYEVTAVLPKDSYRVKHLWYDDVFVRHRRDLVEFDMDYINEEDIATLRHRDMSEAYISNEDPENGLVQVHWVGLGNEDRTWEDTIQYLDTDLYEDW